MIFGKRAKTPPKPDYRLSVSPGIRVAEKKTVDGVRVEIDERCWTWTIINDDKASISTYGYLVDMDTADSKDQAFANGMTAVKRLLEKT